MKLCYSRSELEQMPPGPKLVLATAPTLEAGGSRQLFAEWAGNPKDLIIFVGQAQVLSPPGHHWQSLVLAPDCQGVALLHWVLSHASQAGLFPTRHMRKLS